MMGSISSSVKMITSNVTATPTAGLRPMAARRTIRDDEEHASMDVIFSKSQTIQ